jgi:UDP-N-acetylmuramate dehydrogenase
MTEDRYMTADAGIWHNNQSAGEAPSHWLREVPLAPLTTFGIGGCAEYFIEVRSRKEFIENIQCARFLGLKVLVLGGGSNVLVGDRGCRGLVVRNAMRAIRYGGSLITAYSGCLLASLVKGAQRRGLTGLEFAAGIPGTLGGALYGNAGAWGAAVGDILVEAELLTPSGDLVTVGRDHFRFGYRSSALHMSGDLVVKAVLALCPGDPALIAAEIERILKERASKHPRDLCCAGSFFKNVDSAAQGRRIAAGKILDECGAKGLAVGQACVWEGHANFIVNRGGARACDVKALSALLKHLAREHHGILLEEEVQFLGDE